MQWGGGITFNRNANGTITDNLLIKGNNLIALHTLKQEFSGKVKLIYIDPPYNTGNDSFKYNDRFNHSTWLTFMKNRLEIAKDLLREDGVIFVQIDDNEQAYLKVLMDEIFGRENFVGDMIRKTKSTTNNAIVGFNTQHENTIIFAKNKKYLYLKGKQKTFANYKNPDNDSRGAWTSSDPSVVNGNLTINNKNCFEIKNPYTGKIDLPPQNRHWQFSLETFNKYVESGEIVFKKEHKKNERGFIFKRYQDEIVSDFNLVNSLELCDNKYMNQVATKERNQIFGSTDFMYPKPESAIEVIIAASTTEGDIVLDFFAGSGTTPAVAHKMKRQWIAIEQMDYIQDITKLRLQKVIEGEQGGISKALNWQGGGDFVYLELAKYNQNFVESIQNTESTQELFNLFKSQIQTQSLLNYHLETQSVLQNETDFLIQNLQDAKELLITNLNLNMLYIPNSLKQDPLYNLTQEDIQTTKSFYKEEK